MEGLGFVRSRGALEVLDLEVEPVSGEARQMALGNFGHQMLEVACGCLRLLAA